MELLVVVNCARVLGPKLTFGKPYVPGVGVQRPSCRVEHVGIECQPIDAPVAERKFQERELRGVVDRPLSGISKVVFRGRVIRTDSCLCLGEFVCIEETRDDDKSFVVVLLEMFGCDFHVRLLSLAGRPWRYDTLPESIHQG